MPNLQSLENALPVAPLKLVVMDSATQIGNEINDYLVSFRKSIHNNLTKETGFQGYVEDTYIADAQCPRFGTGEGKGVFKESIRGKDLFIFTYAFALLSLELYPWFSVLTRAAPVATISEM